MIIKDSKDNKKFHSFTSLTCHLVTHSLANPLTTMPKSTPQEFIIINIVYLIHHKTFQSVNKQYLTKLEEVGELQGACMKELQHQRYRMSIINGTIKRSVTITKVQDNSVIDLNH